MNEPNSQKKSCKATEELSYILFSTTNMIIKMKNYKYFFSLLIGSLSNHKYYKKPYYTKEKYTAARLYQTTRSHIRQYGSIFDTSE